VTDVSSSEDSSDEDDIAGVALTDFEPPLPPPPMCLMAKGNSKVSDGCDSPPLSRDGQS
jgi:hypothetical protein